MASGSANYPSPTQQHASPAYGPFYGQQAQQNATPSTQELDQDARLRNELSRSIASGAAAQSPLLQSREAEVGHGREDTQAQEQQQQQQQHQQQHQQPEQEQQLQQQQQHQQHQQHQHQHQQQPQLQVQQHQHQQQQQQQPPPPQLPQPQHQLQLQQQYNAPHNDHGLLGQSVIRNDEMHGSPASVAAALSAEAAAQRDRRSKVSRACDECRRKKARLGCRDSVLDVGSPADMVACRFGATLQTSQAKLPARAVGGRARPAPSAANP